MLCDAHLSVLLLGLLAAATLPGAAAATACNATTRQSSKTCVYREASVSAGDALDNLFREQTRVQTLSYKLSANQKFPVSTMCSKSTWAAADACKLSCPLRLYVTEPADMNFSLCLSDNQMQPPLPNGHFHSAHPLVTGAPPPTLRLTTLPQGARRGGCHPTDYAGQAVAGTLLLLTRGGCFFHTKLALAREAGVAAVIVVNTSPVPYVQTQMVEMTGSSAVAGAVPAAFATRHHGGILLRAMDRGQTLRAHYELSCEGVTSEFKSEVRAAMPDCPHPILTELCSGARWSFQRLCSKCAVGLDLNGTTPCLRGNTLLPRKVSTLFTGTETGMEVVLVKALQGNGCPGEPDTAQALSMIRGKIVILDTPDRCLPYEVAVALQEAGASGYVIRTPQYFDRTSVTVEGTSRFLDMPCHATEPQDSTNIDKYFSNRGSRVVGFPGEAWVATVDLVADVPAPPGRKFPWTLGAVRARAREAAFDGSQSEAVKSWFIVDLVVLGVLLLWAGWQAWSFKPILANRRRLTVPLSVASSVLSCLCMTILAAVLVATTQNSLHDVLDDAVESCRADTAKQEASFAGLVSELAWQNREMALSDVTGKLDSALDAGMSLADTVASLYVDADGSWSSFESQYPALLDMAYTTTTWFPVVRTRNGFYFDRIMKTDHRADADRRDGLPHVSVTNDGTLYGLVDQTYSESLRTNALNSKVFHPGSELAKGSHWTGGVWWRGHEVFHSTPAYFKFWGVLGRELPVFGGAQQRPKHPLYVFVPIYNRHKALLGHVESFISRDSISEVLETVVATQHVRNLILIVTHGRTGEVLATSEHLPVMETWFSVMGEAPAYRSVTAADLPSPALSALSSYAELAGYITTDDIFDQAEHYTPPRTRWVRLNLALDATGRQVVDSSVHAYRTRFEGCEGGNRCARYSSTLGRWVMSFNSGRDSVQILRNVTLDDPLVRDTRVTRADGAWESTDEIFNQSMRTGADECVFRPVFGNPDGCLLKQPHNEAMTIVVSYRPAETPSPTDTSAYLYVTSLHGFLPSRLALHANGRLVLGSGGSFGCDTGALRADVLVPGQWHTVAAVVDRIAGICAVYVNGTRKTQKDLSRVWSDKTPDHGPEPYVVGEGLRGDVAYLTVYSRVIDKGGLVDLHANAGVYEPVVPSRTWLASEIQFTLNESNVWGINWDVRALLARDLVLSQVDKSKAEREESSALNIRQQEHDIHQATIAGVLMSLGMLAMSLLLFLVSNSFLTTPFRSLAHVIQRAALLMVEEEPDKSGAWVSEVHAITDAVVLICHNVSEYKSYLPMSVRMNAALAETGEAVDLTVPVFISDDDEETSDGPNPLKQSSNALVPSMSRSSSGSVSPRALHSTVATVKLTKRRVTVCVTNVIGFLGSVADRPDAAVDALCRKVLSVTLRLYEEARGVPEVFAGDKFVCTFNTLRILASHKDAGCRVGLRLKAAFPAANDCRVNTSVTTGPARVGILGCSEMRHLTVVGVVMEWGILLERLGRVLNVSVILDALTSEGLGDMFYLRTVDVVFHEKRSATPEKLLAIEGSMSKKRAAEEWMYTIDTSKGPFEEWNRLCDLVLQGRWEKARALYTEPSEDLSHALHSGGDNCARFLGAMHAEEAYPVWCPLQREKRHFDLFLERSQQ